MLWSLSGQSCEPATSSVFVFVFFLLFSQKVVFPFSEAHVYTFEAHANTHDCHELSPCHSHLQTWREKTRIYTYIYIYIYICIGLLFFSHFLSNPKKLKKKKSSCANSIFTVTSQRGERAALQACHLSCSCIESSVKGCVLCAASITLTRRKKRYPAQQKEYENKCLVSKKKKM